MNGFEIIESMSELAMISDNAKLCYLLLLVRVLSVVGIC